MDLFRKMIISGVKASDDQLKIIDSFNEEELEKELDECNHIYKAQRFSTQLIDEKDFN